MTSFIIENVSVPPEVEQAIDKRSSMAAVGNLNDYVKFQMAQGMEKGGGGAGGIGGRDGRRHGDGAADDEPDRRADGADDARRRRRRAAPRPAGGAELLTPAQVAQVLGVGEADVIASLEAGDLKGKKIGSQWRVTRAAVDAFLES